MGRPLNKKYFGNLNIGTNGYTPVPGGNTGGDDGIGGEGVASYGTIVAGSGWTTIPTVTFSTPDLPGGVAVAGTAHYKALSFSTTANGTGYNVGDVLEVATGTATTSTSKARAAVTSITAVSVALVNAGNHYNNNDILEYRTGQDTYVTIRVTTVGGASNAPAASLAIVSGGTRSSAKPTGTLSYQNTLGGTGATFTLGWGVYSFSAPSVVGDYTVFPSTGASGTLTSITPATGTGAKADITMGLLSIAVTQKGSGYTSPADAAVSFSGSTSAAATAVLTTDVGTKTPGANYNAATNQDNAIIIHANTTGSGTKIGDIQKQTGSHRYKVRTADGVAVCKLVAINTPAVKQAYIVATATGGTYYVTKLTAHRARLVTKTGDGTLNGKSVKWTFGSPTAIVVTIENA